MNNTSATIQTPNYAQAAQQTAQGNLLGAQQATQANRVNQNTPTSSLQYVQNPDGSWTANQSMNGVYGQAQNQLGANALNAAGNPINANNYTNQTNASGGGMDGWNQATNLIMNQLQPQMAQSAESQKAQLANQGIVSGTQAYDNAMRTFNQGQNNLLIQAQQAGAQQQNNMVNQNVALQNANNTGIQNNFGNQMNANNAAYTQLGAFNSATSPQYVNPYSQTATAGPDYMGAAGLANQGNIGNMNAINAANANQNAGLYGLGGAALTNPNVTSAIGSGLAGLGSGLSNIFAQDPSSWAGLSGLMDTSSTGFNAASGVPANIFNIAQ